MFLEKKSGRIGNGIKKVSVAVLVWGIAFVSVFAGTLVKTRAYSQTQEVLKDLLGAAKPYGVVAEEFQNSNHNQTCFATNKLIITDQWISAWHDKSVGTTYIKDFDNSNSSYVKIEKNAFNNLVLGTDYEYVPVENKYYILDKYGKRTGAVIDVNNCKDTINVFYSEEYMDVTDALDKVSEKFKKYASITDDEADIVIGVNDEKRIDLAEFKNKQIVVVNMYAGNYTDWQGNPASSFYGVGELYITNKKDDQFVIINMLGATGNTEFGRFCVNGRFTGGLSDPDIADTVIFNAVNVPGNIRMSELCGILVAPESDVTLEHTCKGRVMAHSFVNVSGEMHFISEDQQAETTQKATTQAETTSATEAETTQAETTQTETPRNEITSATEAETTQAETTSQAQVTSNAETTQKATTQAETTQAEKTSVTEAATTITQASAEVAVAADEEIVRTGECSYMGAYIAILAGTAVIFMAAVIITKKRRV